MLLLAQLLEAWAALGIGAGLTLGGLRDVAVQREAHSMVWQFKAVTSSSRSREMRLRRSNCPMAAVYEEHDEMPQGTPKSGDAWQGFSRDLWSYDSKGTEL